MRNAIWTLPIMATLLSSHSAQAGVCNYRLSQLIGTGGAGAVIGSATGVSASVAASNVAGLYIIVHSVSGATMVGSTVAGASAAGTVGIIAGSAGVLGTIVAIVTAPATAIAAVGTLLGGGALEAGCYFADERTTEYDEVLSQLRRVNEFTAPESFELFEPASARNIAYIRVDMGGDEPREFDVRNLYIVNGTLLHRDWGPNTRICDIVLTLRENRETSE